MGCGEEEGGKRRREERQGEGGLVVDLEMRLTAHSKSFTESPSTRRAVPCLRALRAGAGAKVKIGVWVWVWVETWAWAWVSRQLHHQPM